MNFLTASLTVFSLAGLAQTPQLLLPDGVGAWMVQVTTRGGIHGEGAGDFAVSSEGRVLCSRETPCARDFKAPDFQSLVEKIQTGALPAVVVSFCNDCITRTITISRRGAMGIVHTYTASWDETTKGRLPPEVIRIYDALAALMK